MASRLILPVAFILCLAIMWSVWDRSGEDNQPQRQNVLNSSEIQAQDDYAGETPAAQVGAQKAAATARSQAERRAAAFEVDDPGLQEFLEELDVESLEALIPGAPEPGEEPEALTEDDLDAAFTGTVVSGGSGSASGQNGQNLPLAALPGGQGALSLPSLAPSGTPDPPADSPAQPNGVTDQELSPADELPRAQPQDIARGQDLVKAARNAYWKDVANGGNFVEPYEMLLEAIELGAPEAHARIAELEHWGLGDVPKDRESARRRHEDGARAGDPVAQFHFAKDLEREGNRHAGERWLREAAAQGNIHAIQDLERKAGKFPAHLQPR